MKRNRIIQFFFGKRKPSAEVQELKAHLEQVERDDIKIQRQTVRKNKLIRDNHLVADVKNALGLNQ